ncbi:sugar ABC transporter substrate-binding protein [Oceanotoga sp. DSM 15011]|jgi:multiple sugar transport system substrate-binding protein|uniref:sugar ABC transporter substrate-binding protein n=1 Tax=unclassified Oceanotoga TaxID=2618448 RepID=UPI0021F44062|nr:MULTISPECIES: sugar ABC transporter substrate-binding protein [unclassified Oceanotoga]MDN5343272.1 multiple sugar transport system substrate-binding protein [Oceanotoga sp.]UYO98915.1 sugar ABC transporter substrate-binding protein [Oceanotoga sp. DSM 15011]
MKKVFIILFVLSLTILSFSKTLTIWAMGEEAKKLNIIADDFIKENPNIEVKIQAIPWGSAHDKLITGIAGNTNPDLAQMGTTWMAEFGSMGVFENLEKYLKNSATVSKDIFFEGPFETTIVDNKIYGLPWYVDTRVLFYRTDLLKSVGYENGPENWEELYDAAKKLSEKGKYGLTMQTMEYQEIMPFIWQNNADILDEKGNITVTTPEFIEAIDFYSKFFKEKIAPLSLSGTLFQEFANGTVPMYFSGPWMINMTKEQTPEIKDKFNVKVVPSKKHGTSFVGGSNLVMFKNSKNKDIAWKFMEFVSRPEVQLKWYKEVGSLPSVKETWEDNYLKNNSMMSTFGKQLEKSKAPVNRPEWAQIEDALERRVQEACYGTKTPEEAAKDLKKDLEKILR